ncbi:MAG: hypothetical protein AUG51_00245 [Acidobacteria bacterium 13_1_20CM_3_53_8]|nr:MAG: hypothetical protein AUG51_00245 [Acidobacteria bacterium 13_1_20CM_3_53_8]
MPAAPTARTLPLAGQSQTETDNEQWVEPIRWVALAVFVVLPVFAFFVQRFAGRVVWTVMIAALPLFIVLIGYHRWRRICPLAFFSQIPVMLRRPGTLKASEWLERNYYYVSFAVFFFSLWLRLIATNGSGASISIFFIIISLAALVTGALYTGKTWCNYFCPVSFIEKIYTEPHGLRTTLNSQCEKCTACKHACPDINEENGYWKEINLTAKRFVYYAFPGLVFGFYFYYYLQAGTWSYYFTRVEGYSGAWVNQPGIIWTAFLPGRDSETAGFFFMQGMPRSLASVLTLAVCALLSFLLFSWLQIFIGAYLRRRETDGDAQRVRHVTFSIAAFTAFLTFYTFAGAPTLWKLPWAIPHLFLILIALTATLTLARRVRRQSKDFAEETLARSILRRWIWDDMQPPRDLHEAFLIHTIRSRENARGAAQTIEIYKEAVRETLANGFVTREEVHLLESLRNQLQIKKSDHDKVMAALADEDRALLSDPARQVTVEKRLQLATYSRALEQFLGKILAADGNADDSFVRQLRSEYRVTEEEHAAVLDDLLGGSRGLAARLAEEIATVERAAKTMQVLDLQKSPTHDFLKDLLRRRRAHSVEILARGLSFSLEEEEAISLRAGLCSPEESERVSVIEQLRASLPQAIADKLLAAYRETSLAESSLPTMTDTLAQRTHSVDPYVRAVALYALGERGAADTKILVRMLGDEHELVRETAAHLKERAEMGADTVGAHDHLITVEKMIALRSAPIFSSLGPGALAELARASREDEYAAGQALCMEGEEGNEVFIILSGEVNVMLRDGLGEKMVNSEVAGGFIGELAVLDPAPRSATLRASEHGAHVLRLGGEAFRNALNADPSIAAGVIRTLAQRLRHPHDE